MNDNPSQQHQYQYGPAGPSASHGAPPNSILPSGPDRPSPIGMGLAGVGILLLAVGSLIPQVSFSGDNDELEAIAFTGLQNAGAGLPGLAPALVLVILVGWTAAGVRPNLQWAAKLGGIGLAALTAAAALHPVMEVNSALDGEAWEEADISASAGGGIWLFIIAAILLAVSIFMMRWTPQPQPQPPAQPAPQQPIQPTVEQHPPTQQNGWPQVPPQQG